MTGDTEYILISKRPLSDILLIRYLLIKIKSKILLLTPESHLCISKSK